MKRSTSQASGQQLKGGGKKGGDKLFLSIFHLHPGHLCLTPFKQGRSSPGNSLWCLVVRLRERGKKLFKKKTRSPPGNSLWCLVVRLRERGKKLFKKSQEPPGQFQLVLGRAPPAERGLPCGRAPATCRRPALVIQKWLFPHQV